MFGSYDGSLAKFAFFEAVHSTEKKDFAVLLSRYLAFLPLPLDKIGTLFLHRTSHCPGK